MLPSLKGEIGAKLQFRLQDLGKTKTSASAVFWENILYELNKPSREKLLHFLSSLLIVSHSQLLGCPFSKRMSTLVVRMSFFHSQGVLFSMLQCRYLKTRGILIHQLFLNYILTTGNLHPDQEKIHQTFGPKKISGPKKIFGTKKILGLKRIQGPKRILSSKKKFGPKNVGTNKTVCSKNVGPKTN